MGQNNGIVLEKKRSLDQGSKSDKLEKNVAYENAINQAAVRKTYWKDWINQLRP